MKKEDEADKWAKKVLLENNPKESTVSFLRYERLGDSPLKMIDREDPFIQMIIQSMVGRVGLHKTIEILNDADILCEEIMELNERI